MSPRAVEVVRTYLELRSAEQLRAAPLDDTRLRVVERSHIDVDDYRRLYRAVGERWHWHDRTRWTDATLAAHLRSPRVRVWECLVDGESAGFFELDAHDDDASVEIAYFGLVESFIGQGLGKAMLACAVRAAWALGPARVWLHTCTLDSPHALPNYKARGFEEVRHERFVEQLPDTN